MPPRRPSPGSLRDVAILCAGAAATGITAYSGFSSTLSLTLGIATVAWTTRAILARRSETDWAGPPATLPVRRGRGISPPSGANPPRDSAAQAGADLHAAANASDDLLLLVSADATVLSANTAASEFFGTGGVGLIGRSIEDLLPQTEIIELFESARTEQRRETEIAITGRDARRVFRVIGAPLAQEPRDRPRSILLSFRDITEFQSALRLGGEFVASVSHELRTPLASIKAALETLEQSVHDDPEMTDKLLAMIDTNVNRLEALTADVLRLSQLESSGQAPEFAEVEVRPAVDSIGVLLDPLLNERRLSLELDLAPELACIRTDPRLFELILKNLLENAGKFAFESTRIRIVARTGDTPDSTEWRIIDRGVGIPIHHQARVFDRFYQVDAARTGTSKRRGTGLGLAIVQNAVRALGGSIRVESVWQQGTTMIVELPNSRVLSSPSPPNSKEAVSS
ncbi:MAG: PAS domain-containing protein [Phycisphaeraceae bacterium]|nr:PAS domain-containing protein [Phycisphaeraceae bacterium]